MKLSAYGVESDDFPNIDVYVDFTKDSSHCRKWYFNPAYKESEYTLTKDQMETVRKLLENSNIPDLIHKPKLETSDEPTSYLTVYETKNKFSIEDYGLMGDAPLKDIYKIVYRINPH